MFTMTEEQRRQALTQETTSIERITNLTETYYLELLKTRLPASYRFKLVRDYHQSLLAMKADARARKLAEQAAKGMQPR